MKAAVLIQVCWTMNRHCLQFALLLTATLALSPQSATRTLTFDEYHQADVNRNSPGVNLNISPLGGRTTFHCGERIIVNKFVYRLEPIERGDVVVFRYPRDPSKSYIQRVIGMAGDRIRIEGGEVYVNGQQLDESYVPPEYADTRSYPEVVVPAHSFFVLGDHRSMSNDSRDFGAVNQSYIYGKAVFGYWPMDKLGIVR